MIDIINNKQIWYTESDKVYAKEEKTYNMEKRNSKCRKKRKNHQMRLKTESCE